MSKSKVLILKFDNMNTNKWYNYFITDLSQRYNSDKTISMYAHNVKKFLIHFNNYREPKEIPTQEIKEYLLTFKTLNTRKQNLCSLRKFYQLTIRMPKKITRIPYPKKVKSLPKVIDSEYLKETISNIDNLKHKAIISLAYSCALRVSEVINLKIEDIDSKRMIIHIINSKGNKDRIVKLSENLLSVLRLYFKEHRPKVYLFNGQCKLQYTASSCNKIVKLYLGSQYHFHLLRHSSLTDMHENGVDIATISKIAGHNSIKTSMIYTHISNRVIQNTYSPI